MTTIGLVSGSENVFERTQEFDRLRHGVVEQRKPMLVYGGDGSGKTRLLTKLASSEEDALYVATCDSPTSLLNGVLESMRLAGVPKARLQIANRNIRSLQSVVQRNLDDRSWILLLDNLQAPSTALGHLARQLHYYGRTPLVFAGRSQHMEDIGTFRTFCTDRASRLELKPWAPSLALDFAKLQAAEVGLTAKNLEEALKGISQMSEGYPGRIIKMVQMAREPRYRTDDQVKFHVIWLDYRLRGTQIDRQAM